MDNNEVLKKEVADLKMLVNNLQAELKNHTHSGQDGSNALFQNSIKLNAGSKFQTGNLSLEEYSFTHPTNSQKFNLAAMVVGQQATGTGITKQVQDGAQITVDHQPSTNKSTNQTFYYGTRSPFFSGDANTGRISSGGTSLSQSQFTWKVNELDGAYLRVYDPATGNSQFDVFEIASNTASSITITGGTWSFSSQACTFVIFVPIYLGAADNPWRRAYVGSGAAGGVRFGFGDTNGGQNGLLYSDSAGDLYYRNYAGSAVKLN